MSSLVPGNVSTTNEELAPLLEKLKRSYVPIDVKTAFNKLLEHMHNDKLDDCIEAGEELLKHRIPDTTRTRVHILIASCLADPDEMEEHYEKALHLWTLLNTRYAEDTRVAAWLRGARAELDALSEAIQDERSDDLQDEGNDDLQDERSDDQSNPTNTPNKLAMSAIAVIESAPILGPTSASSNDSSSQSGSKADSETTFWRSSSIASSARSPASSHASSLQRSGSRLFGAIAWPGQQLYRLPEHIGMSPATILKLAWDPNRTIRGRTTLPSRPSERRASSPSESPTPAPRRDTEQYFKSMFEPPSPSTPVAGSKERNGDGRNLSPPKLKLPKSSGSFNDIRKKFSEH